MHPIPPTSLGSRLRGNDKVGNLSPHVASMSGSANVAGFPPSRERQRERLLALSLTGAALLLSACAMQPVQPWEKGDLAKPSMTFTPDPLDDRFTQHIYTSKENASGGYGAGGGGCGCN